MKLTTCINNHFYDSDKYASCPYCAKAENGTGDLVTEALRPQASLRKPERERTETLAAPKQESELLRIYRQQQKLSLRRLRRNRQKRLRLCQKHPVLQEILRRHLRQVLQRIG